MDTEEEPSRARDFLQPVNTSARLIELADHLGGVASREEHALSAVKEVLDWAERPIDGRLYAEYMRIRKPGADKSLDAGGPEGYGQILSSLYARSAPFLSRISIDTFVTP